MGHAAPEPMLRSYFFRLGRPVEFSYYATLLLQRSLGSATSYGTRPLQARPLSPRRGVIIDREPIQDPDPDLITSPVIGPRLIGWRNSSAKLCPSARASSLFTPCSAGLCRRQSRWQRGAIDFNRSSILLTLIYSSIRRFILKIRRFVD